MGTLGLLGLAALVFLLAYGATRYLCSPAAWLRQLDQPNERSLHAVPTPRTGGLAILASIVVGLAISQALFADGEGSAREPDPARCAALQHLHHSHRGARHRMGRADAAGGDVRRASEGA